MNAAEFHQSLVNNINKALKQTSPMQIIAMLEVAKLDLHRSAAAVQDEQRIVAAANLPPGAIDLGKFKGGS